MTESESNFHHISNSLPALGRPEEALELVDTSVSGKGDAAPELLRPALGRPMRLLDRTEEPEAGNLVGGRIVTFEWIEGSLGNTFGPSLFGSNRDE